MSQDQDYAKSPQWFKNWEEIGLIAWKDKNQDGKIRYSAGNAFEGIKPKYLDKERGLQGERLLVNPPNNDNDNEVYIDRDIIVLANPEIAKTEAERFANELSDTRESHGETDTEVIGPTPAYPQKLRDMYRWQILLKGSHPERILELLPVNRLWTVDVDPASLG